MGYSRTAAVWVISRAAVVYDYSTAAAVWGIAGLFQFVLKQGCFGTIMGLLRFAHLRSPSLRLLNDVL